MLNKEHIIYIMEVAIMKKSKQTMTKLICLAMVFCSLVFLVPTAVAVNTSTDLSTMFDYSDIPFAPESDFYVQDYEDGVILEWYYGSDTRIRIPDTIGGKKVIAVSRYCFFENKDITHLILPDTLLYAEHRSFENCSNLEVIHLGSLKGGIEFHGISGLMDRCQKLRIMSMSDSADFPLDYDGWGRFGEAFYTQTRDSLEYIYIGSSMSNVGVELFYGDNLKWVEVGSNNSMYSSVNGVVYNSDRSVLEVCPSSYENSEYVIPSGVEEISYCAFQNCSNIKKLTIPQSVIRIEGDSLMYPDLTIVGVENSTAHKFAIENGLDFIDPNAKPTEPSTGGEDKPTDPTVPSTGGENKHTDTTDPVVTGLLGDANKDGEVNIKDATEIQKAVAALLTLDETAELSADVDGSGDVNIKDATAIQKYIAGIETGFDIGKEMTV